MTKILFLLFVGLSMASLSGQSLRVSDNGRFLMTSDGEPFFWLADTAWELTHRCDREEVKMYLRKRKAQGFNVIQCVALAELHGLDDPNPYGHRPLVDNDPATPNEDYFKHVDHIIDEADKLGLYIALLPTWGDKVAKKSWGVGPEVFDVENAFLFGKWMGERYSDHDNIVWVIGGDRNPRDDSDDVEIWRAMARGVQVGVGANQAALMTFHPQPQDIAGSSTWFQQDDWLDFNMHQTGHCANRGTYKNIQHDYNLTPIKPVLDGEPLYEDHPNCFNAKELGYSSDVDIRRIMYWNIFAGACGQTYGCHDVWQMYKLGREGINGPLRPWPAALDLPMANQSQHLKTLMLSRPYFTRIPAQDILITPQSDDNTYTIATRDSEGSYAMIYSPEGKLFEVDTKSLKGNEVKSSWYDPRTGAIFETQQSSKSSTMIFTPPSSGRGHDWVLILDAL